MKLKGLTLIETIVAMIISVIVVSLTYLCFNISVHHLQTVKNNSSFSVLAGQVFSIFSKDLYKCRIAVVSQNSVRCIGIEEITYSFESNVITRKQGFVLDSFQLFVSELKFGTIASENNEMRILSSLNFSAGNEKDTFNFCFTKSYNASILLNLTVLPNGSRDQY